MAPWARIDGTIDVGNRERAGEREGVFVHNARACDFSQREQTFLRLGFAHTPSRTLSQSGMQCAGARSGLSFAYVFMFGRDHGRATPSGLRHNLLLSAAVRVF